MTGSNICGKKGRLSLPAVVVTLVTRAPHSESQSAQLSLETHSLTLSRCLCEVRTRTHSLWSGLNQPKEQRKLRNPLYVLNPLAIWPSVEPQSLRLWQGDPQPHILPWGVIPSAQLPYMSSSSSSELFLRWIHPSEPSEVAWEKVWQIVTDKEKMEGSQPMVSASEPQL